MVDDPFLAAHELAKFDPFLEAHALANFKPQMSTAGGAPIRSNFWGGDKFPGGFGATILQIPDYWTLRERSSQLFNDNLYARGLIRRLITNEINTGLKLQAEPNDELLDILSEDEAERWAENVENRFEIWANTPRLCDYEGRRTFYKLEEDAKREAYIEGDILVVLHTDRRTGLPQVQLIRGGRVVTPLKRLSDNRIVAGVEVDSRNRDVAYWVRTKIGLTDTIRIPAFGSRTGKRLAWLLFGSDKRMEAVRGMPLLGLILQSMKELDRYRDSEQRAATLNAILAMFLEKTEDKPGTRAFSAGAIRRQTLDGTADETGVPRQFNIAESIPGVMIEELQHGEIPRSFKTDRPNANYGVFEAAVINAIAWANEIPPEILTLAFSNNYSASKAAVNEFKAYLARVRAEFGATFCQPIYNEWLVAEVLADRLSAPGFLESRRDPIRYVEAGAWVRAVWAGPVKPSVDLGKDVKAYNEAIDANLISASRASEDLFGVRYFTVLKRRTRELRAEMKMRAELGIPEPTALPAPTGSLPTDTAVAMLVAKVMEEIEDYGENSSRYRAH